MIINLQLIGKMTFNTLFRHHNNYMKILRKYSNNASNLESHRASIMAKSLPKKKPIEGVQKVVLVSSGKGGVGKSTTAVNLATAVKIAYPEKNVGLLDTDVFGPSIPLMMNLHDTPLLNKENLMVPLTNYGVKCMSMGFLIEEGSPVIWRGLMVMQALEKLLRQVYWGSIDYLIVDTPPGTGDTHLSLVQNIPIDGVILVTTPQIASLQVTKRGAVMYQKLNVPIIGIVENMSSVQCSSCSHQVQIFGDGTSKLAKDINLPILESFALQQEISDKTDQGIPIVVANRDLSESKSYLNLSKTIVDFLENKSQ